MKEKELRLAIAYFGGVSLAIYQHGVNRELLNLVRASKIYHRERRDDGDLAALRQAYPEEPEGSTAEVYQRFLQAVGAQVSLRVIIDVIAGSSAGAINGIALARAVANDLSLTPLTDMWLSEADMLKLLAPEARAKLWHKWYFRPFIRPMLARFKREGLVSGDLDAEMQDRISVFLRSRWFKPPLDGKRFAALVLDGLDAMERPGVSAGSLLPRDTRLDLLVTVTDFRGVDQSISIHDPPVMQEREHRHLLRFSYEHRRTGARHSDLDLDNLPALAFAARASASYPGAFPPAQIGEIDELLAARYRPWPTRALFLKRNFGGYSRLNLDPQGAVLVDGSVLDNKPIMATLDAIHAHAVFREVDRRLLFIDPHSGMERPVARPGVPGFFATLRGALSDLPRNDPVYRELAEISRYNKQTRRLKEAIGNSRTRVAEMIIDSTGGRIRDRDAISVADLRSWRLNSTRLLSASPIVYDAWMRTLVLEAVDFIVALIRGACGFDEGSVEAQHLEAEIEQWAGRHNILVSSYRLPDSLNENLDLPEWGKVVVDFGVVYKRRRLHFVLSEINNLYEQLQSEAPCTTNPEDLDLLKIKIHKLVDDLSVFNDSAFLSDQAVATCRSLFGGGPGTVRTAGAGPVDDEQITRLVRRLNLECELARSNDEADALLASPLVLDLGSVCRTAILTAYLGYFYWDALIRPVAGALALETGPIAEILIDRISPDDARSLSSQDAGRALRGGTFAGFGGFLSRATRENDYLWGRLHAIDRLFDILATTPRSGGADVDIQALKKDAFARVLDEESARLSLIPDLIKRLREAVEQL